MARHDLLPAAAVVVLTVVLAGTIAAAQERAPAMRPGMMGPGIGVRPAPATPPERGPQRPRQEPKPAATPQSPAAPASAASLASGPSAARGAAETTAEHRAGHHPFYREPVVLVLAGLVLAGAGVVGYRLARRTRRRGVAGFVTEAVFVVDLADSTHLATHYGDGVGMRARTAVKDRTLEAAAPHGFAFAENTGDGYLMTFPSVPAAVRSALALRADLRRRPPDLSPAPAPDVRIGIGYGEILLDGRGDRHGAVMNKTFRLIALTPDSFTPVEGEGGPAGTLPDRNRIFLDEEAARELEGSGIPIALVGYAGLKGFSGLHRVYQVTGDPGSR